MNGEKAIFHFKHALVADDGPWRVAANVRIRVDGAGLISEIAEGVDMPSVVDGGLCLPGMPNAHSHAFQRAMAGLTEVWSGHDDFWSWRSKMFAFLDVLTPEDVQAIATQLYMEMLEAGYTDVVEFHYLHHQNGGVPYDNPAEMGQAHINAASATGLNLLLTPVLYNRAGFDGAPLVRGQNRFYNDVDSFLELMDTYRAAGTPLGMAFHSLRAVAPEHFAPLLDYFTEGPLHIHISEQVKEVDECVAFHKARPVEWLMDHVGVDSRWTLVHATHLSDSERQRLAQSGAVAALCPSTECSLGDGVFPTEAYLHEGGRFAIGSDSHISVDVREELRLLEYAQRLFSRKRAILGGEGSPHVGVNLYSRAVEGGSISMGRRVAGLTVGAPASFVVLDDSNPTQFLNSMEERIDSYVFSGFINAVKDVYVAGEKCVSDGVHIKREAIAARYKMVMERLMNKVGC